MNRRLRETEVATGDHERLAGAGIVFGSYCLTVSARAARRKAIRAVRDWMVA